MDETDATRLCARLLTEENELPPECHDSKFGSTYALDRETEAGTLHILFRLSDGDREAVTLVAVYLDGARIDPDAKTVDGLVLQVLRVSPYLAGEYP